MLKRQTKGFLPLFKKGKSFLSKASSSLGAVSRLAQQAADISNPDTYKGVENMTLKDAGRNILEKAKEVEQTGKEVATPFGAKVPERSYFAGI